MSGSAGPSRDRDRHMGAKSRYAAQIGPANPVKKSTIPQSTVGYLFGRRIRRGTERQLCLWRQKIGEKIDALGVGKAWPIGKRASHFNGSVRSYTSNTPQSTSPWLDGGGIGQGMEKWLRFLVCIFLEFWPAVFFYGIIKLRPSGRIRSLHPVASLNNVTINQRAVGCGPYPRNIELGIDCQI
jgi:hypothetical protein